MFDESHEFLTKKDKYLWRVEKLSITSKEVLVASTFENHRPQVHFFQSEKRNETFVAKLRKRKKEKDNWIPILQNVSHILRLNIFVSIPYPIRNNNNNFITRMKKKKFKYEPTLILFASDSTKSDSRATYIPHLIISYLTSVTARGSNGLQGCPPIVETVIVRWSPITRIRWSIRYYSNLTYSHERKGSQGKEIERGGVSKTFA